MRIGPLVIGAGLLLLTVGVVSSRADAWDTRAPSLTIPLAMNGIHAIDIRDSGIEKVVISSAVHAQVYYPAGRRFARHGEDGQAKPPSCRATGATLRCEAGTQFVSGISTMHLPPGRYRLLVGDAEIIAQSDLQAITIEAYGSVSWAGPVAELDVKLVSPPRTRDESHCSPPRFGFRGGRLRSMRIQAGAGHLSFDHLSEVGSIEVHAAQEVGLEVDKAADIARITVLPLERNADVNSASDSDVREACAGAARAAALAAME